MQRVVAKLVARRSMAPINSPVCSLKAARSNDHSFELIFARLAQRNWAAATGVEVKSQVNA